jgi:hypothetical protein
MSSSTGHIDSFVYFVPFPPLGRILGLSTVLISTVPLFDSPLDSLQFLCSSTINLVGGILYLVTMANLILLYGIHPRRWRMRLEFDQTGVKLVPSIYMKQLGDPSIMVPIEASTKEIVICRGSQDVRSPYDSRPHLAGFRVLVRSTDGHDRELKVETGYRLSARQATNLSGGISPATRRLVRFVQREITPGGTREIPWTPGAHT